ncbi:MAG TPA: hypothetical protein VK982_15195 [Bacteroidales bacterium]|nr:hypothetical protein [Bacteroidales bacterium]
MRKIIILQILLAALVIGSYYFYRKADKNKWESETVRAKALKIEQKYENTKIPDSFFQLVENAKEDTSNLIRTKLVFRFTEVTCGSCVTLSTRLLVNYAEKIGWNNIIFLATNNDVEFLNRYKRVSRIKTKIYSISNNFFVIDDESLNTPYMFTIGPDSTIKNLFVSVKENAFYTEQYLKNISSIFQSGNN